MDDESRSHCSLTKTNPFVYAQDPTTQMICKAYKHEDEKTHLIPFSMLRDHPERLKDTYLYQLACDETKTFEAHNASFERQMWFHHMHRKFGFPDIPLERWFCSMAKCMYQSLPAGLDMAAKVLKLKHQKDKDGHSLMLKMCKPRKPSKANPDTYWQLPQQIKDLQTYCIRDVNAEFELSEHLPELPEYERQIWLMDQRINDRGVCIDLESVNKLTTILDKAKIANRKEITEVSDGAVTTPDQHQKIKAFLHDHDCKVENTQKDTLVKALENPKINPAARALIEVRIKANKAATKKLAAMERLSVNDGRAHGAFFYHGARTGRWTSKGLQLQNMVRITFAGVELEVAIDCLDEPLDWIEILFDNINTYSSKLVRPMFIAAPGKTLISADFSSIEAKVLLWLANDKKGLELYAQGKDLYVWMASKIFNVPYDEIFEGHENKIKKYSDFRFVGKQCILGLGYGMGTDRFIAQCLTYGQVVSRSLAERAVKTYRKTFRSVTKLWRQYEQAFRNCIEIRKTIKVNNIVFRYKNKNVYIDLPSGRSLSYQNVSIDEYDRICYMGVHSKTKKWTKLDTWGGTIVEHVDQALSRDIFAQAMMRLENNDFPVVLHTHDEPICEVLINKANLVEFRKHLNYKEPWLKGCPVSSDSGWAGHRYRKG